MAEKEVSKMTDQELIVESKEILPPEQEKIIDESLKQQYKRIEILFKKQKTLLGAKQSLAPFKPNILLLIRKNRDVEFYEGVKGGVFEFEHSNPDIGKIKKNLGVSKLLRFPYGTDEIKGYILYEDEFYAYPIEPLLDAQNVQMGYEKLLNDYRKHQIQEAKETTQRIMIIVGGVVVVAALFLSMGKQFFVPASPVAQVVAENVTNIVKTGIQNATVLG